MLFVRPFLQPPQCQNSIADFCMERRRKSDKLFHSIGPEVVAPAPRNSITNGCLIILNQRFTEDTECAVQVLFPYAGWFSASARAAKNRSTNPVSNSPALNPAS